MTSNPLAKHYGTLTPDERFSLLMAASERGDNVECRRLSSTAKRVSYTMCDHAPLSMAFNMVAMFIFVELLAEAAEYLEYLARCINLHEIESDNDGVERSKEGKNDLDTAHPTELIWELVSARGYLLNVKVQGWKRFCERRGLPPFAITKHLPGFDRLQLALTFAEWTKFDVESLERLNLVSGTEDSKAAAPIVNADRFARVFEDLLGVELARWGGR